jgi:hypothetical protein
MPIKFVDERGRVLSIYQLATQLTDEHLLVMPWVKGNVPRLDAEQAIEISRLLLRHSVGGAHAAICAQFHIDPFEIGGQAASQEARWLDGTLDYAAEQGVPIWAAAQYLSFVEARHDASLVNVAWHPAQRRLSFELAARAAGDHELSVMAPLRHGNALLGEVQVDGVRVKHRTQTCGGVQYASVSVPAGSHQVVAIYS